MPDLKRTVIPYIVEGKLCLWRYEPKNKNYPGWHLTGDADGLRSLINLIRALQLNGATEYRTVAFDNPTERDYAIPGCRSAPVPVGKGKVLYLLDQQGDIKVEESDGAVAIHVNARNADALVKALQGLIDGVNDVNIGRGETCLWFW